MSEKASKMVDGVVDGSIDMVQKGHELELRRLLSQLEHAKIPDSVCEETAPRIGNLLDEESGGCDGERLAFVCDAKNWCRSGFRVVIDGGSEKNRTRVMRYLMFRAIVARWDAMAFVVSTYDWPTILPIVCDYKHPGRLPTVEGMRSAKVLGLAEVDPTVAMTPGVEAILTSVLRGRSQSGRPTVITLRKVFDPRRHAGAGEIHALAVAKHDVGEDKIVRLRLAGGI